MKKVERNQNYELQGWRK